MLCPGVLWEVSLVDVLVVAALQEEFAAARSESTVRNWEQVDVGSAAPYLVGQCERPDGSSIVVALARPTRTAGIPTATIATMLAERLGPTCLAMCGVCAGNPAHLALGDVVVAETAYQYDEGKLTDKGFLGDQRQVLLSDEWVRAAQDLVVADLPSFGAASAEDATAWLLERLLRAEQPRDHPARARYLPGSQFGAAVQRLMVEGLIRWTGPKLALTPAGRKEIARRLYTDVDGPSHLPFRVAVGPMASGNAVVADGGAWQRLRVAVRSILAVDMEAAAIASVAYRLDVPHWLVVKGVMDHANPLKDDRFKAFAAKASAQVMWRLLDHTLAGSALPQRTAIVEPRSVAGPRPWTSAAPSGSWPDSV
jgi:nucleoside phosphorylase